LFQTVEVALSEVQELLECLAFDPLKCQQPFVYPAAQQTSQKSLKIFMNLLPVGCL
jgi:hypothetical protein